jgi:hypothetical protein
VEKPVAAFREFAVVQARVGVGGVAVVAFFDAFSNDPVAADRDFA